MSISILAIVVGLMSILCFQDWLLYYSFQLVCVCYYYKTRDECQLWIPRVDATHGIRVIIYWSIKICDILY